MAGIDAAWIAQHAERVGMMLSLPDNDVEFTIEEVQTAVKTTLMDLGVVDPGKIDVASRGRTGPYEVTLSLAEREAVLSQGELDVFQHAGTEEERTFRALETDQFGNVVQSAKSQAAGLNESERAERLEKNAAAAAERKGTHVRVFIDGTSQSASLAESKRTEFFAAAMQKLRVAIEARCKVKPQRMALVAVKDAFGNETNKGIIFINLPKGTVGHEWIAEMRWDVVKWIHMGQYITPLKVRMEGKMLASAGLKQCCFLPRCRSIPCSARNDALALASCESNKREHREHEPTWKQEKDKRQKETADNVLMAKEQAAAAVARRREKMCKQWTMGRCHKMACAYKHGSPQEASVIECSHGTACNRTGCPFRHGAEEPQQ